MPHTTTVPDPECIATLREATKALEALLRIVIDVERRFGPARSPLALLADITTNRHWTWLQPLYRLIADIDHAIDYTELPASEVAAIGAHARALLSGVGAPIEQAFLDRYRPLLQTDPEAAIAHGTALQALRRLPPEPDNEAERRHAPPVGHALQNIDLPSENTQRPIAFSSRPALWAAPSAGPGIFATSLSQSTQKYDEGYVCSTRAAAIRPWPRKHYPGSTLACKRSRRFCLDGQAEEAMNFYTSIFRYSKVGSVQPLHGDAGPGPKGSVMSATFEIEV